MNTPGQHPGEYQMEAAEPAEAMLASMKLNGILRRVRGKESPL